MYKKEIYAPIHKLTEYKQQQNNNIINTHKHNTKRVYVIMDVVIFLIDVIAIYYHYSETHSHFVACERTREVASI